MSGIKFEAVESTFSILNPFKDFAEDSHMVEVRRDPLLGDTSVYNPFLRDKAKSFFGECDAGLVKKLVEESSKNCIFCGESVEKITAKYPPDVIPEGRIRVGEAILFANLFAVGQYHPVVALSKAHFLRLSEFNPGLIGNGLSAAQKFLDLVYTRDQSALYTVVSANYLFPAGASLVHPHIQMLVTPLAYSYHARLITASLIYYRENNASYYADLIREEKKNGLRYIAHTGGWHWLTAFSPIGNNEVIAVHERECDFGLLSEADLLDLAGGISRVLGFYDSLGYLSFNYSLFSVRKSRGEGAHCLFKIITRQNLYNNYRNDDYFLQKMLQSELIINLPEELAQRIKGFF
jgi:UDPglucose--hexose-1-phosphate uridylyltransferase